MLRGGDQVALVREQHLQSERHGARAQAKHLHSQQTLRRHTLQRRSVRTGSRS